MNVVTQNKIQNKKFHLADPKFPFFSGPNNPWSWIIRVGKKKMRFILDLSHFILNFILTYNIPGIFCIASPCDLTRSFNFLCQPIRIETNLVPRANCHLHERTCRSLRTLRYFYDDGNRNVEKSDRSNEQNNTSAPTSCFLVHFFAFPHNHAKFTWERQLKGDKFYHLFLNAGAGAVLSLQLQPKFPTFK